MGSREPSEITDLLHHLGEGDRSAVDRLFAAVYQELRNMAGRFFRKEAKGITLQPTALVHEAYLKLVDQSSVDWQGRTHFFAVAAQAMRRDTCRSCAAARCRQTRRPTEPIAAGRRPRARPLARQPFAGRGRGPLEVGAARSPASATGGITILWRPERCRSG